MVFHYVDGLIETAPHHIFQEVFEPPFFNWIRWAETNELSDPEVFKESTTSIKSALDFLDDVVEEQGPFDAILGFSQGASVACSYLLHLNQREGSCSPFRFALFFSSGGLSADSLELLELATSPSVTGSRQAEQYPATGSMAKQKLTIPSLHVYGNVDELKNDALEMMRLWDSGTAAAESHSGGHVIPRDALAVKKIAAAARLMIQKNNVKGGFFLEEDLARFDAPFFGFTKAEAASLDPEQRLLLECAYETFENAGVRLEDVNGTETGVYIGTFMNDWGEITRRDPDALPIYQPTGSGHSMLAGRLSYFYNLKGPSMTMDTACSASFVALHNACSALRNGECTSALVGGVNSLLNHDFLSTMSTMSFLSADGRSYTYDKRANGYARGEGVACILIKPLDQAIRDGDPVRAVIRGVALNQDGKTPGITHPNGSQQAALIRKVYEDAGLNPNDTSYLETHGTGTQAGDVTEAKALHEAFGRSRDGMEPLVVGSVKTNIGHLEGASGLAGLVKTVMMLENEVILPNSGFTEPNEKIRLKEWNMEEELSSALDVAKGKNAPKGPALGFVFTGQGAQWYAMGRELMALSDFRRSLNLSSACLASLGAEWDVVTELSRDVDDSNVNKAIISQPLCTILQLALFDLLEAWDIKPAAVVGHSSGELAAAYAAGLASRYEVISAAYHRGLVAASSNEGYDCVGAMAAVSVSEERVLELLARVQNGKAAIACYNSPSLLTVSGDDTAIVELVEICKSEGLNARKLVVDVAVNELMVYPAAGYVAMAIEAARQRAVANGTDIDGYELRDLHIGQALVIPDSTEEVETMMTMKPYTESARASSAVWDEFLVYSASEDGSWTENCRGLISVQAKTALNEVSGAAMLEKNSEWHARNREEIEKVCTGYKTGTDLYDAFQSIGLEYEGTFANVTATNFAAGRAIGQVVYPDVKACMPMQHHSSFVIHPAFLDSTFQVAFFGVTNGQVKGAMVPTFISNIYVSEGITKAAGDELAVYTQVDRVGMRDAQISLNVYDDKQDKSKANVSLNGLTMTSLSGSIAGDFNKVQPQTCYYPRWRPSPELLLSEQFASLCVGLRVDGPGDDVLKLLDEATFYMAEEALERVPESRLHTLREKSQKLYQSFKGLRDRVYAGAMPQDVSEWTKTSPETRLGVWERVQSSGDEGALYLALRENLHRIILEETDPLSVVMNNDVLGKYYAADVRMSTQCRQAAAYVDLLANQNPHLKILEIGAGTGGATIPILEALGGGGDLLDDVSRFLSYDITDITTGFFEKLQQRTKPWTDLLKFGKLNIEQDPGAQGYELGSYDLVIASNVLHATEKMERTLDHVKQLLKPGGKLVLVELMRGVRACTSIFGVFDGWWIGAADRRTDSPLLDEEGWHALLKSTGFTGLDLKVWDLPNSDVHQGTTMISSRVIDPGDAARLPPVVIVVDDDDLDKPLVKALQINLALSGSSAVQTIKDLDQSGRPAIVVAELKSSLLKSPTASELGMIQNILLNRDTVLWVTQGATLKSTNPDLNLVSGLFATLRTELGGTLVHLDLGSSLGLDDPGFANIITRVYAYIHEKSNISSDIDLDFVERNGVVMIRRCEKDVEFSHAVSSTMDTLVPETQAFVQPGRPLKLKIEKPGMLDSLYFASDEAMAEGLKDDEIDIEVQATALNFRDVMMAMGQIETYDLGAECSGIVARIGPGVKSIQVGDRVAAQAFGTFSTFARTREIFVSKIASGVSMEEAATLPIVYTTAVYAIKVARLAPGETVLIHCAAGGLGQALVMLCKLSQADIYITVGTLQKKQFMMDRYGIPEDRIFSSRDTGFERGIMRATEGRGIDVVFNSLSSNLLRATWACIASFGRFIELGKRDFAVNSRLEMAKFAKNVTFAAVDLAAVIQERPEAAAAVQREAIEMVMTGKVYAPQPVSVYSMEELQQALRTMQTGRHMGKLVIKPTSRDRIRVLPQKSARATFRPDASYLLVGGLGGIGQMWSMRMIELGAKNLVCISPSGARSPKAKAAVEKMQELGAVVHVFECDASNRDQLSSCLAQMRSLPPIRGVFHGGSNFTSGLFKDMTLETYYAGLRPKVHSTWNLHELLPKDMDHFVFFSSATGIVGNTSQGAYSAASAFQDAFADYRNNHLGLPAVSIDLGMVAQIGYVAQHDGVRQNLEAQGYKAISSEGCMAIIEAAVMQPSRFGKSGNVITGLSDSDDGNSLVYSAAVMSLLRRATTIRAAGGASGSGQRGHGSNTVALRVRDLLKKATTVEEVEQHVRDAILAKTCSLLMLQTDDVDISKPMSQYGLDSLIAVEMRNWISSDVEVTVPILQLLGNQSIQELSKSIAHQTRAAKALGTKAD
ncbi:hypothetical protein ACHAQA_006091 [Verticillium albo-atrum]